MYRSRGNFEGGFDYLRLPYFYLALVTIDRVLFSQRVMVTWRRRITLTLDRPSWKETWRPSRKRPHPETTPSSCASSVRWARTSAIRCGPAIRRSSCPATRNWYRGAGNQMAMKKCLVTTAVSTHYYWLCGILSLFITWADLTEYDEVLLSSSRPRLLEPTGLLWFDFMFRMPISCLKHRL